MSNDNGFDDYKAINHANLLVLNELLHLLVEQNVLTQVHIREVYDRSIALARKSEANATGYTDGLVETLIGLAPLPSRPGGS
ncbi:hypothetical protein [Niveispirillum sp.]|uniref:hypothetical protein n=1 Tax=Niveispirillum sp. TaxID=1917217 RepID=UPI001B640A9C|nr:hypothetical protein [Niveispirillum sp.]MBP7336894.1 hypothetical protein [Niveispirillum sp.]